MAAMKTTSMTAIGMNREKTIRPSGKDVRCPSHPRIARKITAGMAKSSGSALGSESARPRKRGTA